MAVLAGPELVDWGVKTVKGRWSDTKQERIRAAVSHLIERYRPDVLAVKKPHPSRTSPCLDRLRLDVEDLARRSQMKLREYRLEQLEASYGQGQRIGRYEMADILCTRYPFLSQELQRDRATGKPYYIRMFDAIALATVCRDEIERRR